MRNRILGLLLFTVSAALFAAIEDTVPTQTWLLETAAWATSVPGLTLLGIVVGAAQILMRLFQTPLANFTGKVRLVAVAFFSLVGAVAAGMTGGISVLGSLLSGAGLAAIQVFIHQIYTQFFEKAD